MNETIGNGDKSKKRAPEIPTVSRILPDGTLIELIYDPEHRTTAFAVSRAGGEWTIEAEIIGATGEKLVPYSAANNLIANECVVLPSKPEEYGTKAELLADIQAFLHRYVDLSPLFEKIAAHYVLLTWVYNVFNEVPYLRFRGDFGTGKTRALMALGSLCYKAFFASGASTVSPIFHVLDTFAGTLVLDESDLLFSDAKADLVKVLNNGTVRGMPVLRTIVSRNREFNPHAFRVYGPKIVAMRHSFEDAGLESRFLTEEMGTRPFRTDVPISIPKAMRQEALDLRNRLLHFRFCNFAAIKADPNAAIAGIEPRLNQTALSLLSLVDDGDLRCEIAASFLEKNDGLAFERQETPEGATLAATAKAFAGSGEKSVPLREIAGLFNEANCREYGGPVSARWIGQILRRRLHILPRKSNGIYVVPQGNRVN